MCRTCRGAGSANQHAERWEHGVISKRSLSQTASVPSTSIFVGMSRKYRICLHFWLQVFRSYARVYSVNTIDVKFPNTLPVTLTCQKLGQRVNSVVVGWDMQPTLKHGDIRPTLLFRLQFHILFFWRSVADLVTQACLGPIGMDLFSRRPYRAWLARGKGLLRFF